MPPSYNFNDFKHACNDENLVIPSKHAIENAETIFNLKTKKMLLYFISNDGLEELDFINTKPWEMNPDPDTVVMIDAYEFKSMNILGYIAFFYSERTNKWIIKSFKLSINRNMMMYLALKKAGLCNDEKIGGCNE